jgi:hypothetical protein
MHRILKAILAAALVSAVVPAFADAGWEETQECVSLGPGRQRCKTVRYWVPEPGDGGDPDPREGISEPREASWFEQNCEGRPGTAPPIVTEDGTVLRQWVFACRGVAYGIHIWIADPEPGSPPAPDPEQLADILWVEMLVQFPRPTTHVAPTDTEDHGFAFVQAPTYFWIDDFQPITRTLTLGPTWVTLTATPVRIDVDLGNGDSVSCVEAPAFGPSDRVDRFQGCGYTYRHSSAMSPNGETWPVTVTAVWTASWTSSSGAGGTFGEAHLEAPTRELPVAEIQAIVTDVGADS